MLPAAGAGGGGAAGGGAWVWQQLLQGMGVRAVARAQLVLGLAMAAFALYALSLKQPGDQLIPVQCAATAADVMDTRGEALLLLLLAAAQAATGAAAEVLLAADSTQLALCTMVARSFAFAGQVLAAMNAYRLYYVVHGVAAVAVGTCLGHYSRLLLVLTSVVSAMFFCLKLIVGLAVRHLRRLTDRASKHQIDRVHLV